MGTSQRKEVEKVAKVLFDQLRTQRSCRFTSSEPIFRANVVCRLRQLIEGDNAPIEPNSDD